MPPKHGGLKNRITNKFFKRKPDGSAEELPKLELTEEKENMLDETGDTVDPVEEPFDYEGYTDFWNNQGGVEVVDATGDAAGETAARAAARAAAEAAAEGGAEATVEAGATVLETVGAGALEALGPLGITVMGGLEIWQMHERTAEYNRRVRLINEYNHRHDLSPSQQSWHTLFDAAQKHTEELEKYGLPKTASKEQLDYRQKNNIFGGKRRKIMHLGGEDEYIGGGIKGMNEQEEQERLKEEKEGPGPMVGHRSNPGQGDFSVPIETPGSETPFLGPKPPYKGDDVFDQGDYGVPPKAPSWGVGSKTSNPGNDGGYTPGSTHKEKPGDDGGDPNLEKEGSKKVTFPSTSFKNPVVGPQPPKGDSSSLPGPESKPEQRDPGPNKGEGSNYPADFGNGTKGAEPAATPVTGENTVEAENRHDQTMLDRLLNHMTTGSRNKFMQNGQWVYPSKRFNTDQTGLIASSIAKRRRAL